jgi:two-component system chemotaxis sensor kinase CheA
MNGADKELINEFIVESQEGLANIEQQMLSIEAGGADVDLDLVNAVFRTMHTIKGTAGFLGLDRIGALAHGLEELLDEMRNRELVPSSELVTSILRAADFMKGLIEAVETSNDMDIGEYIAELHECRRGSDVSGAMIAEPLAASQGDGGDLEKAAVFEIYAGIQECYELVERVNRALIATGVQAPAEAALRELCRTTGVIRDKAATLRCDAVLQVCQAVERVLNAIRDGERRWNEQVARALCEAVGKCREGLALAETSGSDAGLVIDAVLKLLAVADVADQPVQRVDAEAKAAETASNAKAATEACGSAPSNASEGNIRVDVALLDKLMTRVGELVLARNQVLQYCNGLNDPAFLSTAQRLNLITAELQESVMKTRMQPIGNVWTKFPRVVRDLAAQLGKQVVIEMEGKETELDKTIVEAIKDPLTHLESPEVRRAAGKPAEGLLLLRAYHEGGQVNIEITDDGAGLNLERIRRKGIERGLVSADQAARMSDREAAQLIFAPGFSTAETVTSVSGRGVGMDVVKSNIERISGTIDLQSEPGRGTTVRIKIPLTLAIIPALIVGNDGDRYAIPQVSLLELVRLEGDEAKQGVEFVHGAPVYRLRGKLLPLVHLSERLGLRRDDVESDVVNIVVLQANDRRFGLVVDKINDAAEIVVKPLSRQLKGLSEYAGATIMGDGAVALILDVMGLAMAAGLTAESRDSQASTSAAGNAAGTAETLLVVDLGDTRRFALPTSMVSRLEKIAVGTVEQTDGREVVQYRGAILPLVRLTDVFGGGCGDESEELNIVVYADGSGSCGFVVGRIVDVVETEVARRTQGRSSDNLLGTAVIQGRVTDIVNLPHLAQAV